jgi:hypothetical protein
MFGSPEREKKLSIDEAPEEFPEIPVEVENKHVVTPTPTQFKGQVTDDKGAPIIQTPQSQAITIELPAEPSDLKATSKGSPDEAITWFAATWVRMFKKALHLGWGVISGRRKQSVPV